MRKMRIVDSNLNKEKTAFLDEELSAILAFLHKRGRRVADADIVFVDLSIGAGDIPESPAITPPSTTSSPSSFPEYCENSRKSQSYQIMIRDSRYWCVGGGYQGVLYAFYALMKHLTGIRWYGVDDELTVFPKEVVDIPLTAKPDTAFRGIEGSLRHWNEWGFVEKFMLWMARNGWNQLLLGASGWGECDFRGQIIELAENLAINLVLGGHSMDLFLPESLFNLYPEYFGLRDGRRCLEAPIMIPDLKNDDLVSPIQPCFSNPECREAIAANIAAFIRDNPFLKIFSLWPHDGVNNWCHCDACRKTTPFEMIHKLALKILELYDREIFIETLVYSNLLNPPRESLECDDRIYTLFCPYLRHYKKRFYEGGMPRECVSLGTGYPNDEPINPLDDREYGELLDKWLPILRESGVSLGVFAYYQLVFHDETRRGDRSRYLRQPAPGLIRDEIACFIDSGMRVYYDCSWPYPGCWPDARLVSFYSALLWNKKVDVNGLIQEYHSLHPKLFKAIDALCGKLDRGEREIFEECFFGVESAASELNDSFGKSITVWLDYVRLGCESWTFAQKKDFDAVVRVEKQIIRLFDDNSDSLKNYIGVEWMKGYSNSVIKYYSF